MTEPTGYPTFPTEMLEDSARCRATPPVPPAAHRHEGPCYLVGVQEVAPGRFRAKYRGDHPAGDPGSPAPLPPNSPFRRNLAT